MASASFVSSACDISSACTTDVDFTIPTVTASQLILVNLTIRNNASPIITAPTGFTNLLSACQGTIIFSRVYYRVATGAENSSCVFAFSASTRAAVITSVWNNINTACPFNVSAAASSTGTSACCEFPILTTTIASAALVYFTGTASNPAITNDAALTEREETNTTGGNRCQSWQGDELKAAAGATACRVNTLESAQVNTTFTIALATASAAAAGGSSASTASSLGIPGFDIQLASDSAAWESVLSDVLSKAGVNVSYGLPGNGPTDRVAKTGTMSLSLNNSYTNTGGSQSYYSPGHANAKSGFELGAGMQVVFQYSGSTFTKFRGMLDSILPAPGVYRERVTQTQSVDWIDFAAKHKLNRINLKIGALAGAVIDAVVSNMPNLPAACTIATAQLEWPYALDTAYDEGTTALGELQRIANSDGGWIFIKGDSASGNHLVFQDHRTRLNPGSSIATLSNTMVSMRPARTRDKAKNFVRVTSHPRVVDLTPTSVLYTGFGYPVVAAGCTIVIEGNYTDPAHRATRVGAASMVTPVAGTDYIGGTSPCGQELTSDLTITACLGANSFSASVVSSGSQSAFVGFQLRGAGIFDYAPVSVVAQDAALADSNGRNELNIDMPYESRESTACSMAYYELYKWKTPDYSLDECTFVATGTDALVKAALQVEPGMLVAITEDMTGISASQYFVQNVKLNLRAPNILTCTWGLLRRVDTTNYWQLNIDSLGQTTVDSGSTYTVLGP